jgi:hypothetical protein
VDTGTSSRAAGENLKGILSQLDKYNFMFYAALERGREGETKTEM